MTEGTRDLERRVRVSRLSLSSSVFPQAAPSIIASAFKNQGHFRATRKLSPVHHSKRRTDISLYLIKSVWIKARNKAELFRNLIRLKYHQDNRAPAAAVPLQLEYPKYMGVAHRNSMRRRPFQDSFILTRSLCQGETGTENHPGQKSKANPPLVIALLLCQRAILPTTGRKIRLVFRGLTSEHL